MPSTLTWIDHDSKARSRALRILSLFQERNTRDELGLGSIRDAFSDSFFPGTSTIQTRLRYMLLTPWIYTDLECKGISAKDFAYKADQAERKMIKPLLASKDNAGAFGKTAGRSLKRLSSSVYWSGLRSWGILCWGGSQEAYHMGIDVVYKSRRERNGRLKNRRDREDDAGMGLDPASVTWHPQLPNAPEGFPEKVDFNLTRDEAEFIMDRIQACHPESLLAHLGLKCKRANVDYIWDHPDLSTFSAKNQELIEHARLFSGVMYGASLLYNVALAEQANREETSEEHRNSFDDWKESLDLKKVQEWSLDHLWELTMGVDHTIGHLTRTFVSEWVAMVCAGKANLLDNPEARTLIRNREIFLKGARSRFTNGQALDQWGGASGQYRLSYRWPNARWLLEDLYQGLEKEDVC